LSEIDARQVPAFQVHEFGPRRSEYCVCMFVLNENGKLLKQLERSQPWLHLADFVIADGGSTDGSTAPETLRSLGINTLLIKTGPGKLGAQMRMGFAWALTRGYKGVVCIDGNNKDDPAAIALIIEKLQSGYDHIQGSRFVPGGVSENLPFARWAGLRLLHAPLISLASGFHYTDTTNGFRGYSARLLSDPSMAVFRDVFVSYELHWYLAIRAVKLGFRVCEAPVARRYPRHGPVPTKISPVRGALMMLRLLFITCLGFYDPKQTA